MRSRPVLRPARRLPPQWAHIERPHVNEMFDPALRRATVVLGAAGWGKTTAVASWAARHRSVWLAEGARHDPVRIVTAILEAASGDSAAGEPSGSRAADHPGTAAALCEWLGRKLRERLVVVVDDVHQLPPASGALRLIEGLCRYAPDLLHLVLVSQRELPFSLARLDGQGLLTRIDATMLAFDREEIELLLRGPAGEGAAGGEIDGEAVGEDALAAVAVAEAVWARTGGWPVAVRAAIESIRAGGDADPLEALDRLALPAERFHTFLAEEVIAPEPPAVQDCLRRVAVFGEVTDPEALGCEGPVLADLTRRGLLRQLPGDTSRWTLMPPLAGWYRHETVMPTAERTALHVAAAREYRSRGAYPQALRHLVAAGDRDGIASTLVDHGPFLVRNGAADVVLEAADLVQPLPDDPRLQRTLGEAQQMRGYWAAAFESYRRAGAEETPLQPELAWRIMWLLQMQGELAQIPSVHENVVEGRGDTLDEVAVLTQAATAFRFLGDLGAAERCASRALGTARRCGRRSGKSMAHSVFGMLAAAAGDHRRTDAHFTIAMNNLDAENDLLQVLSVRVCRALHLEEMGSPREAYAEAGRLRDLLQRSGVPFLEAQVRTIAGRAALRLGDLATAQEEFSAAVDIFQRISSRFLAWPLAGLGDVYRLRGQLARARAAYEEALTTSADGPDSIGLSRALTGLARVRAADDPSLARALADRAVALAEGLHMVAALLTRGWVALLDGDRAAAALDAVGAATAARRRRDDLGLAEAIVLGVLASTEPAAAADQLAESVEIWHEAGCVLEEATTRLVGAGLTGTRGDPEADRAAEMLRAAGVDVQARRGAGPLAALHRATPAVQIRALGVFQVIRDGVPVSKGEWQSKKARDLLKILVARRRPTPRDRLLELLWPDGDPAKCGNRLSVLLSVLRDVLQPDRSLPCPLQCEGAAVWLDRSLIRIDVDAFLERSDVALKAYRSEEPDAREQLLAALASSEGEFLEDEPYEDWAGQLTEEIRSRHLALLRALVEALRAAGEVDQVTEYGMQLLELDPYDEEVRLDLVSALLEAGRLGEARRHYQQYVRRMQEIDVEPHPMPRPSRRYHPLPHRVPRPGLHPRLQH